MKFCIRIPRVLIPENGLEEWAVIDREAYPFDRTYWEDIGKRVGDKPSTLHFIFPRALEEEGSPAPRMWQLLEAGSLLKLTRGLVYTEREIKAGVRRGIVAAIDLECYSSTYGESSPIRPLMRPVEAEVKEYLALRRDCPLEFPSAVLLYGDRKDRAVKIYRDEELEKLYDFTLSGGGGLRGYFVPPFLAETTLEFLHSKHEPSLAVLEGTAAVEAAKRDWEQLKPTLSVKERDNHPARFFLCELINVYDEQLDVLPVHRLLCEVDREAFVFFFTRELKCKREGNVLIPSVAPGIAGAEKADALITEFLNANGGRVRYLQGAKKLQNAAQEEDTVGVLLPAFPKEELFDGLRKGKLFPAHTLTLGREGEKRYYLEGREISYD